MQSDHLCFTNGITLPWDKFLHAEVEEGGRKELKAYLLNGAHLQLTLITEMKSEGSMLILTANQMAVGHIVHHLPLCPLEI